MAVRLEDDPTPLVCIIATKLRRAARKPKFALSLAKVLEPPVGTWQEEARAFWAFASQHPASPRGIRVVCLEGGELVLGTEPVEYELHGKAAALLALFSGDTVLGEELLAGHLYAVGSLQHTAELTGRSLAWMMGG